MCTLIEILLLAIKSTGVVGFGLEKKPDHTCDTAGLMCFDTVLLVLIPVGFGLASVSFTVPSSELPKYWNTVLVAGVSKSKIVVCDCANTTADNTIRTEHKSFFMCFINFYFRIKFLNWSKLTHKGHKIFFDTIILHHITTTTL
jgi:hypothetical protein